MKSKEWIFPIFLFVYHLAFAIIAWQYNLQHTTDAHRYWNLTQDWHQYLNVGTDVIKFINYPFAKLLRLPFWAGFIIHNLIGYYAIYELYRFGIRQIKPGKWNKYLLMGILLLPNLHFWTSIIGKEPLVFLAITWIIVNISERRFKSPKLWIGGVLLMLIRPHVALFLLMAIGIILVISGRKPTLRKGILAIATLIVCMVLYLLTMRLLNRNPFDWAYILERNDASLIAFKRAGSYVPMIDYNWLERIFALNFRPLFWDARSLYDYILSAENLLILVILMTAVMFVIKNCRQIKWDAFAKIAILFFIVSSLFFIQRYSCLGIFVRTKIMYMPFLLIAAVQIIAQIKSPNTDQA